MNKTGISWTDFSSNPLRYRDRETGRDVWACVKCSPGCANCYAETQAERFRRGGPFTKAEMAKVEPYLDEKELRRLLRSKKLNGNRVFLCDMTDIGGDWVPDELLDRLFAVMALRPDVTFQLLTKRPERMREYLNQDYTFTDGRGGRFGTLARVAEAAGVGADGIVKFARQNWPLPNVWLGTSIENNDYRQRASHLLRCPAAVHFLSLEPLLGPIDLPYGTLDGCIFCCNKDRETDCNHYYRPQCPHCKGTANGPHVSWIITGCESGPRRREWRAEWDLAIQEQCQRAGVAVFRKQVIIDGRVSTNPDEWPAAWRVQEFPEVTHA